MGNINQQHSNTQIYSSPVYMNNPQDESILRPNISSDLPNYSSAQTNTNFYTKQVSVSF